MFKRNFAIILTITALFALSACSLFPTVETEEVVTFDVSAFTKVESEVDTTVDTTEVTTELATTVAESSAEETTAEVIVITTDNAENTESSDVFDIDKYTEPPLTEDELAMAVPEFLDEDQQLLYRNATNIYNHLWGRTCDLIEYEEALTYPIDKSKYRTFENENGRIYTISQGVYKNWDNFITLVESVFTKDAFEKQNSDLYFVEYNGMLAFDNGIFRSPLSYNPNFADKFELVSKSENEVIFTVTGYYSAFGYVQNELSFVREARFKEGWDETKSYTISMIKTENGWRFDEFHNTEIDVQEQLSLKDFNILGTYIWNYSSVEQALADDSTETLPRITFYADGTCNTYFRLKEGVCQFDGTYFIDKHRLVYILLDLSDSEFDGFVPSEFVFSGNLGKIMLKSYGFSTVCRFDWFYRMSDEDLAKLNITLKDSNEINESTKVFLNDDDPPLHKKAIETSVPEFLDEEQQMLYRKAFSVLRTRADGYTSMDYNDSLNYYISQPLMMPMPEEKEGNGGYYIISQGRYQNWDDFIELIYSVFTEEFCEEKFDLNTPFPYSYCYNYNGKLAYMDVSGIYSYEYMYDIKDKFELVSKTDNEIVFNLVGHYSDSYPKNENSTVIERKFTIRMVNTESGWRFDEFHVASAVA